MSVSPKAWSFADSATLPHFYFNLKKEKKSGDAGESSWTPSTALILALAEALKYVKQIGMPHLIENAELLARATRAAVMGTFAMGITHEVSTPLGVILGRAEQILGRTSGDERVAHGARVIIDQADRLRLLIRSFLDLARGGAPNFSRVASSSVVSGAVALVDHRFEKAGVRLLVDVSEQLPVVQGDRSLLEHALVNLLLNACEACQAGGTVEVQARADGQTVAFVVIDDGVGIRPEDAARAAEPFFTTKPEGKGTGLGLAIASEIVKSHRGALMIEPRLPRGTRARLELPIAPDEVRHAA